MKNIILLSVVLMLFGCSASDSATCVSRCKFTKDLSSNQFFYFPKVDVDCETNKPSAETLKKLQASQTDPIFFCGCD